MGLEERKYHWECQSSSDNSMLVRFFEYDTQIALDEGAIKGNVLTVTLPHSAVLFLRCTASTPDMMKIRIVTPEGDICYNIHVMKTQMYSIDDIFDKDLLFLIPFYIFAYESQFEEYNANKEKLDGLKKEYKYMIDKLEGMLDAGKIDEYTKCTIVDMSNKVLEHIAQKYSSIRKGVKAVMGGKVLEYEAKTIKREGIKEGKLEILIDLVRENVISLADAASKAELSEEEFVKKTKGL